MTTNIMVWESDGGIIAASDTQYVIGDLSIKEYSAVPKQWSPTPGMVVCVAGALRSTQIAARASWEFPEDLASIEDYGYEIGDRCVDAWGRYGCMGEDQHSGCTLIVGVVGFGIVRVAGNGEVFSPTDRFLCSGSGWPFAAGAMYAYLDGKTQTLDAVMDAMRITAHCDPGTGGPFDLLEYNVNEDGDIVETIMDFE